MPATCVRATARLELTAMVRSITVAAALLGAITNRAAASQPDPLPAAAKPIPAADLQADVRVFREALESLHPGLYRYNTKEALQRRFEALQRSLARERTLADVFVELSKFLATLECGHSYCNFVNQPDEIARALFENSDRLPFRFVWIDRRMIITANQSASADLHAGLEVLAIDGVPVSDILGRMLAIARADGANDAKRIDYLAVDGTERYAPFDIFFPLLVPEVSPPFELALLDRIAGKRSTVRVDAITYEQRTAPARVDTEKTSADEPLWSWTMLDDRTAYLRMPTWAVFNSQWDWQTWLNEHLDDLVARAVANLVVDLRGNEGGLDCGVPIVTRLITRELPLNQLQRVVRYRRVPDSLNPYLDTWDPSFRDWGDAAVEIDPPVLLAAGGQSFFRLTKYDDGGAFTVLEPTSPRYKGRVFVLINAACSSATFEFAAVCKQAGLATLVGQPTGGSQRGINGGAFFFCRLPHTKIEFDIPLIAAVPDGSPPDAGVEPDVLVTPSAADVAAGVDAELRAVRAIIAKAR